MRLKSLRVLHTMPAIVITRVLQKPSCAIPAKLVAMSPPLIAWHPHETHNTGSLRKKLICVKSKCFRPSAQYARVLETDIPCESSRPDV